jgi:hypothetical protein
MMKQPEGLLYIATYVSMIDYTLNKVLHGGHYNASTTKPA